MLTYDFITKVMKIPPELILKQAMVLTYRKHTFADRHKFLQKLGRVKKINNQKIIVIKPFKKFLRTAISLLIVNIKKLFFF